MQRAELMSERVELIMKLFHQGVSLIPRIRGTKDRYPFAYKEFLDGTKVAKESDVIDWLKKGYDFAAVCGVSGLVVFDFDDYNAYRMFWDGNLAEKMPSETVSVQTARGVQVWFFDRSFDVSKVKAVIDCKPALNAEVFLHHHLAACPGNAHPSGIEYKLLGTSHILVKPGIVGRAADRLYSLGWLGTIHEASDYSAAGSLPSQSNEIDDVNKAVKMFAPYWIAGSGKHHRFLMALSGYLIRRGISEESAVKFLIALISAANDNVSIRPSVQQLRWYYRNAGKAKRIQGLPSLTRVMKEIEEGNKN